MKPRTAGAPIALVVLVAAVSGCGELASPPGSNLNGTWYSETNGFEIYAVLTNASLTLISTRSPACFGEIVYEILSKDGSTYEVQTPDSVTFNINISLAEDGRLLLETPLRSLLMDSSNADTDALPECTGSGGGTAACSELPVLAANGSVTGTLADTDDESSQGFNYDLYQLALDANATVTIDLTSAVFNPYLYVYDTGGNLLIEDDDGGTGLDARATLDLNAGCFRVEATSYFSGVQGEYTVKAETN